MSMPCGTRVYYYYNVANQAVLPNSATGAGVFGLSWVSTSVTLGLFKLEFLEICEFIWSNRIFLQHFLPFPVGPCGQIAKRIETKAVVLNHGWCHVTSQFRKSKTPWNIEVGGSFGVKHAFFFSLARLQCLVALTCIHMTRETVLPESYIGTGMFGPSWVPTSVLHAGGVQTRFFLQNLWLHLIQPYFSANVLAFSFRSLWSNRGQIWNESCGFEPPVVSCDSEISEIKNFMKYWSWWAVRRLTC